MVAKKKKKQKKNNIGNEEKLKAEPLSRLGFGIVAYMDILWTLIVVFALFTLLLVPTFKHYHEGTGYKSLNPKLAQYEMGTIGNMGYSSVQCAAIPLEVGKLNMQCPYGRIGEVLDYGVNLSDGTATNCVSNDDISQCQPDSFQAKAEMEASLGEMTYLFEFSDWTYLYAVPGAKGDCFKAKESRLFVQYTCIQSDENLTMKYNQMCLITSTAVCIALLFTLTIRYLFQGGKMQQIDWDMTTITAGDYSVEFTIDKDVYDNWKNNTFMGPGGIFEQNNQESPAIALKKQMVREI